MSIITKFKKLLHTPEARHLREELTDQAGELATQAKQAGQQAVEKTKDLAEDVRDRIQGMIDYDTFTRVDIRLGTIVSVEKIEKSDKLLLLQVDLGEDKPRQIVSGIALYYADPQVLAGRQAMFVANLEPRTIFGHQSNGMIFALNDEDSFSILEPDTPMAVGTRAS